MNTTSTLSRPLIALAAALVAIPVAAETPVVVSGEPQPVYRERVNFADLDLRRWGAQQSLKLRVRHALMRVCRQAEGPMGDIAVIAYSMSGTCADLTYRDARPQISAAIKRAKAGQPQLAAAFVITQPARAR